MTSVTLVSGSRLDRREALIARLIEPGHSTAVLAEGLPDGHDPFSRFADTDSFHVSRIAPACLCCTGMLTTRVTLNRLLRLNPDQLFISLAPTSHAAAVAELLAGSSYAGLVGIVRILDSDNP